MDKDIDKTESFPAQVWRTLSAINVNEHTQTLEKKKFDEKANQWVVAARLTYLSWSWAWATLMEHYPESDFAFGDETPQSDGTVTVWCSVTVADGELELTRSMWLPVMDHRNNAIKNPDARQVSDARMRCLTKCLALFGLGHYIYAGEDIPEPERVQHKDESKQRLTDWISKIDECSDKGTLRAVTEDAKAAFAKHKDAAGWAEAKRIAIIKAEELDKAHAD